MELTVLLQAQVAACMSVLGGGDSVGVWRNGQQSVRKVWHIIRLGRTGHFKQGKWSLFVTENHNIQIMWESLESPQWT